jgi:hypothetical protein
MTDSRRHLSRDTSGNDDDIGVGEGALEAIVVTGVAGDDCELPEPLFI